MAVVKETKPKAGEPGYNGGYSRFGTPLNGTGGATGTTRENTIIPSYQQKYAVNNGIEMKNKYGTNNRIEIGRTLAPGVPPKEEPKPSINTTPPANTVPGGPSTTQPASQQQPANYNYTPTQFNAPQYNQMSYNQALSQAQGQLDPIYQRAVQEIMNQRFANQQASGEQAAARGLGHSGLAADAINKVNIAAQSQIGNAALQRASQSAQMAQALMDNDFQRSMALRDQALREYMGSNQIGLESARFNYGQYRDTLGDAFRDKQFDWGKYMDEQNLDFRDKEFDWRKKIDDRDFDFNKWLQEAMLTGRVYV